MDHVAMLKKYLKARSPADAGSGYPFVTVSRQAGAGGHVLARDIVRAAESQLPGDLGEGWEVFDHQLCLLIAQDPTLSSSFDALLSERYRSEASLILEELLMGESRQYRTLKRIFQVVHGLCAIGKVVIVGRAASCVAADLPLHVAVRLVAGRETRVRNMMELLDVPRPEALRAMARQDRERGKLLDDFFSRDINDPLLYDCILNSDRIASPNQADIVVTLLKQRIEDADTL